MCEKKRNRFFQKFTLEYPLKRKSSFRIDVASTVRRRNSRNWNLPGSLARDSHCQSFIWPPWRHETGRSKFKSFRGFYTANNEHRRLAVYRPRDPRSVIPYARRFIELKSTENIWRLVLKRLMGHLTGQNGLRDDRPIRNNQIARGLGSGQRASYKYTPRLLQVSDEYIYNRSIGGCPRENRFTPAARRATHGHVRSLINLWY